VVEALGLLALLALAPAPASAQASDLLTSTPLELRDPVKDLRAAQNDVDHGGGADAYEARADAKRSLGRPFDDYVKDYAEAARQNPKKYGEKYQGILDQRRSETEKGFGKPSRAASAGDKDANIMSKVLLAAMLTLLVFLSGTILLRGRAELSPRRPRRGPPAGEGGP
jgi:hypothetical protein